MVDGPNKIKLTQYLTGAREGAMGKAGEDWTSKGGVLQVVAEALEKKGPGLAQELGEDSKTAEKLKEVLLKSATAMHAQGAKLEAGGKALSDVSGIVETARIEREAMASLTPPTPYQPPNYAPGYQPTSDEIAQAGDDRTAANNKHTAYQESFDAQENAAGQTLAKLDTAFMGAIPPMMAIHGGPDPTAPVPGNGGNGPGNMPVNPVSPTVPVGPKSKPPKIPDNPGLQPPPRPEDPLPTWPPKHPEPPLPPEPPRPPEPPLPPIDFPPHHPVDIPTTNVGGGTDGGTSYQGVNAGGSSATSHASSSSAAMGGGAAAGAAGVGMGAGMMKGGAVRGSVAKASAASVRGIGAGGRAGAPKSLTRGTTAAGSSGRAAASGSRAGASRTAGAAGRAGAAGSSSTKGSATKGGVRGGAKGAAGRAGAAGSTSGKGSAKSSAKGKVKGLFRRGSNGSTSGVRSNKKKDDERSTDRDALVYEQDWLGDDSVAPGVLD